MRDSDITIDYLGDILDAADKIEIFTQGMSYEEFSGDDKTVYAITHWKLLVKQSRQIIHDQLRFTQNRLVSRVSRVGLKNQNLNIPKYGS